MRNIRENHRFYRKTAVLFAVSLGFLLFLAQSSHAYEGCEPVRENVTATLLDNQHVEFVNQSADCVHIGVAVYHLFSPTDRAGSFYYSAVTGLRAGERYVFSIPNPTCAYALDVIVGEPIQRVTSADDYGDRLVLERIVANASVPYCASGSAPAVSAAPATQTQAALVVPLPSPKHTPVPLPSPKVLGAATSTNPTALKVGSDATLPLLLLVSTVLSGLAYLLLKPGSETVSLSCHSRESGNPGFLHGSPDQVRG